MRAKMEVAEGNESSSGEGYGRQEVVMGGRWFGGGAKRAHVDDRAFKKKF